MKTSKDPQGPSAPEDGTCPVLCRAQPLGWDRVGRLCRVLVTQASGRQAPSRRLWGPMKEAPRKTAEGEQGEGWVCSPALAPRSEATKETGKKDALGTSFAFVF